MDAKYFGVTLSNDLEWSKHIATKTNKANSKLSFLCRNLMGCPEKLKQTAYFSLICSDKDERVHRRAARFVKSWYSRYSSVSDVLGGGHLFLKGDRRLDLFCSITKLLTVWHKCPSKA